MNEPIYQSAFATVMKNPPYKGRHFVSGEGPVPSDLMIVGEAPGETEDSLRRPFVGRGGDLLDKCLKEVGIQRQSVYITNVFKLRPPNNRTPLPQELSDFSFLLESEIASVKPKIIVALGATASRWFYPGYHEMAKDRIRKFHRIFSNQPVRVIMTYHPGFILRNTSYRSYLVEDLTKASLLLDGVQTSPDGNILGSV